MFLREENRRGAATLLRERQENARYVRRYRVCGVARGGRRRRTYERTYGLSGFRDKEFVEPWPRLRSSVWSAARLPNVPRTCPFAANERRRFAWRATRATTCDLQRAIFSHVSRVREREVGRCSLDRDITRSCYLLQKDFRKKRKSNFVKKNNNLKIKKTDSSNIFYLFFYRNTFANCSRKFAAVLQKDQRERTRLSACFLEWQCLWPHPATFSAKAKVIPVR